MLTPSPRKKICPAPINNIPSKLTFYFIITLLLVFASETPSHVTKFRICLVVHFSNMFSVFKQYYTYFYIFFYPHIFQINTNNIIQTTLPNRPLLFEFSTFHSQLKIPIFTSYLASTPIFLTSGSYLIQLYYSCAI